VDFVKLNFEFQGQAPGTIISLESQTAFFQLKAALTAQKATGEDVIIHRVYNQERDLRPVLISYTISDGSTDGTKESIFNSDAFQFN
jgi:hypothetical protein